MRARWWEYPTWRIEPTTFRLTLPVTSGDIGYDLVGRNFMFLLYACDDFRGIKKQIIWVMCAGECSGLRTPGGSFLMEIYGIRIQSRFYI
jgi:hypothetical protein